MKGFLEKLAAGNVMAGIRAPLRRLAAVQRLATARRSNPGAFNAPGLLGRVKQQVNRYRNEAASPGFRAKKAVGFGLLGAGALAAGANKITSLEEPGRQDAAPPPSQMSRGFE
jgi:hypothetical protein